MTIERTYDATPERVFAAFGSAEAKRVWMLGSEDEFSPLDYTLDFTEGGREWMQGEGAATSTRTTPASRTSSRTSGSSTRTTCCAATYGSRFR